ncbi:mucoidy inhibitor MuiA family protein [Thalassobellus citreus]|uniref:DUF4139 domain-containing protein n=1 Tax=Thalassobellus citreus TaxID=3367752 RepID=UPI0037A19028
MKNLLFLFLLATTISFSTNQKPTATSINEVTVYVNGAQITRTANVKLPIGTTTFKFDKLSPNIQESSIQISGLKSASVLSINYGINYLSKQNKSEDIEALQNQIKLLNDNIQFETDLISGYEEELKVIHDNRHIGNDNQAVTLEKLQQFADYYRKRITKIKNLIYASSKKKQEFSKQITDIQKQLAEFNIDDKIQTGEITVKLNTNQASELNLIIKYNVDNAGWFPIYDIKANQINAPLQLNYKAHVYQSTGNDWNKIKLTLSTNDPNTNNEKPEVNPKYLNFISKYSNYNSSRATKNYNYKYNPFIQTVSGIVTDESGSPLPGVNIVIKGTSKGTQTDFNGKYSIQVSGGKELVYSFLGFKTESLPIHSSVINLSLQEDVAMLEEVVVVGYGTQKRDDYTSSVSSIKMETKSNNYGSKKENYTSNGDIIEEGITNQRFEIKKPYTIPTNGDITVIEIDKYSIPASFSYFTAPIINENVFLTAKMGDWEQYNLLPGEANIYFEGSYSGKTNINPQATTDSLTISLGVDPNVVVKRNTINNFKKNNFTGSNKIINKAFEIELKNNKQSTISLILMDRVPVSQNKDIKVDDIETGTAEYDSKKGLLEWKLNLKPNQSNTFKISYTLKYPKYKRVNL